MFILSSPCEAKGVAKFLPGSAVRTELVSLFSTQLLFTETQRCLENRVRLNLFYLVCDEIVEGQALRKDAIVII